MTNVDLATVRRCSSLELSQTQFLLRISIARRTLEAALGLHCDFGLLYGDAEHTYFSNVQAFEALTDLINGMYSGQGLQVPDHHNDMLFAGMSSQQLGVALCARVMFEDPAAKWSGLDEVREALHG